MEVKKGTTTIGIKGKDFVVLAADRQATMGSIVADPRAKKILKISDKMAITTAGLVGDAQMIVRFLRARVKRMEMEEGKHPSPRKVVSLLSAVLNANRTFPYWVELIVGAYDKEPFLVSMDAVGSVSEVKDFTATGSGSPVALGVLESKYKEDMKKDEAIKLAVSAIEAARRIDIYTGGKEPGIDVVVIDKDGVKFLSDEEVEKIKKAL